eukprot:m.43539 g.43539  ORF g.43539 m.43539 type:complete len:2596 (+) comp5784_c0_seq3:20-7807(+)
MDRDSKLFSVLIARAVGPVADILKDHSQEFVTSPQYQSVLQCIVNTRHRHLSAITTAVVDVLHQILAQFPTKLQSDADEAYCLQLELAAITFFHLLGDCFPPQPGGPGELPDSPVRLIAEISEKFLLRYATHEDSSNVTAAIARMLNRVSYYNFVTMYTALQIHLGALANGQGEDIGSLRLLPHLHFTRAHVVDLLQALSARFKNCKRGVQTDLADLACRAIWSWIEAYPQEFEEIQKDENSNLHDSCETLFETLAALAADKARRVALARLMTCVLLLSPKTMMAVHKLPKNAPPPAALAEKVKFLDGLKKWEGKEVAVRCLVDICVAATYVQRDTISCLRFFVVAIESELQLQLFDLKKPFFDAVGEPEAALLCSFLIASFRLNPRQALTKYFLPFFANADTPSVYKAVAIRALIAVTEQPSFFSPSVAASFDTLAGPFRSMLCLHISRLRDEATTASPKRGRKMADHGSDVAVVRWALELLVREPAFALHVPPATPAMVQVQSDEPAAVIKPAIADVKKTDLKRVMVSTAWLLGNSIPDLGSLAAQTMLGLCQPAIVPRWRQDDGEPEGVFWDIHCHVVLVLAAMLVTRHTEGALASEAQTLRWLCDLERAKNTYLRTARASATKTGGGDFNHKTARNKLEIVFLTCLCSCDPAIVARGLEGLGLLCDESAILLEYLDPTSDGSLYDYLTANKPVYLPLSSADEVAGGHRAQLKRITKLLRTITVQTYGNQQAWSIVFDRWSSASNKFRKAEEGRTRPVSEDLSAPRRDPLPDWSAMTAFLCALGGVCLLAESACLRQSFVGDVPDATHVSSCSRNIEAFLTRMIDFLVIETEEHAVQLRETVKEALGQELSPSLYPTLLEQLQLHAIRFLKGPSPAPASRANLFVDQAIKVLRMILDARAPAAVEHLAMCEFDDLVNAFVDHLSHAGQGEDIQKTKISFCNLVSSMMAMRGQLTLRHETAFRSRLVDKMKNFVSAHNATLSPADWELDVACVRAIAALMEDLPLRPLDDDADQLEGRSTLFKQYFTFLMNITNRCRLASFPRQDAPDTEDIYASPVELRQAKTPAPAARPAAIEGNSPAQPSQAILKRDRMQRHCTQLREHCCTAMSRLLSANCDVGLGNAILMGYDLDWGVRLAFTDVLTKVLQQGAEFDALGETSNSACERYAKLVSLVLHPHLHIVQGLAEVVGGDVIDDVVQVLVNVFDANNALMPLLFHAARWEVDQCLTAQTLFRRNSLTTKLGTVCARMYGQGYLRGVLQKHIADMISEDKIAYEIDPGRLRDQAQLAANTDSLSKLCRNILDAILSSEEALPPLLRLLLYGVRQATIPKFTEAQLFPVGGILFLRFFTPALVTPQACGVWDQPLPPAVQRGLLLCSKVLQALANNAQFTGVKEAYMQCMNAFVVENTPRLQAFLDRAATPPRQLDPALREEFSLYRITIPGIAADEGDVPETAELTVKPSDAASLHRHLADHAERLGRVMAAATAELAASHMFDELTTELAQLGEPPKAETDRRSTVSARDSRFEDFMNSHKYLAASMEAMQARNIFYPTTLTKTRRPAFVYVARRYVVQDIDADTMIYFVLATLRPAMRQPFDIIVDLTMFSRENDPALEFFERFVTVAPPDVARNLGTIMIVNAPSYLRVAGKKLHSLVVSTKLHKKMKFTTSAELAPILNEPGLPSATLRMEEATKEVAGAQRLLPGTQKRVPCMLKMGSSSIQVVHAEKLRVFGLLYTPTNIYSVAKIAAICPGKESGVLVKYNDNAETLTLDCPDNDAVMRTLSDIWQRHLLSEPAKTSHKVLRPSDVPGTLLNMALLNLGSPELSLRLAAYNFLSALTATFQFDIGGAVMEAAGLAIPQNNSNFIISISQSLAAREPGLTMEFLTECVSGLTTSSIEQKHLCLEYMQPWLPNVKNFATGASDKMLRIIRGLVNITVEEKELYPSLQAKVWFTIASVDDLVKPVLDEFLKAAISGGPNSTRATVMADAAVTLASANCALVSELFLARLLATLEATAARPAAHLDQHETWADIQVLLGFLLMLSFNNRLNVKANLPTILHISTMVLATGPAPVRAAMHGTLVNLGHSLCTSLPLDADAVRRLRLCISDMMAPKFILQCGVQGSKTMALSAMFAPANSARVVASEAISLNNLELLVFTLRALIDACPEDLRRPWRQAWMALAQRAATTPNPALQPRAFVTLGVIATDIAPDTVPTVLRTFTDALRDKSLPLVEAVCMCLARLLRVVEPAGFHTALFWTAIGLIQLQHKRLFAAAVPVLEACIVALRGREACVAAAFEEALMAARTPIAGLFDALDRNSGVSFTQNFSFSLSLLLLKGLGHQQTDTVARTTRVLAALHSLDRSAENALSPHTFSYLCSLLPQLDELRFATIRDGEQPYARLLDKALAGAPLVASLMVAVFALELQLARHDTARTRFICDFLAHAAAAYPQAFSPVDEVLQPFIEKVVGPTSDALLRAEGTPQGDAAVLASCLTIVQQRVLAADRPGDPNSLTTAGFRLLRAANFDDGAPIALLENVGGILSSYLAQTAIIVAPATPLRPGGERLGSLADTARRRALSHAQRTMIEERRARRTTGADHGETDA